MEEELRPIAMFLILDFIWRVRKQKEEFWLLTVVLYEV